MDEGDRRGDEEEEARERKLKRMEKERGGKERKASEGRGRKGLGVGGKGKVAGKQTLLTFGVFLWLLMV